MKSNKLVLLCTIGIGLVLTLGFTQQPDVNPLSLLPSKMQCDARDIDSFDLIGKVSMTIDDQRDYLVEIQGIEKKSELLHFKIGQMNAAGHDLTNSSWAHCDFYTNQDTGTNNTSRHLVIYYCSDEKLENPTYKEIREIQFKSTLMIDVENFSHKIQRVRVCKHTSIGGCVDLVNCQALSE